jgi:seryl-tRNA synthetase
MNPILDSAKELEERIKKMIHLHHELKAENSTLQIEIQQLNLKQNEQQNIINQLKQSVEQGKRDHESKEEGKLKGELDSILEKVNTCIAQLEQQ